VYLVGLNYLLLVLPPELQLKHFFSVMFSPLAFLMGVPDADIPAIADLLGTKIAANEFVAYRLLNKEYAEHLSPRSLMLATYALTGFANLGSVGIQIGGIGALVPERRGDLARLGIPAMLIGFLATVINACIAGMLADH
jgi:CNT family concentrative nucleoside transporter